MATYTNPDGRVFTVPTYSDLSDGPQNFKDFAATMPSYGNDIYNVSGTVQFTAHHISRVLRYTAAGEYVVDDTAATGTQVTIATGNAFVSVMTSSVQVEPATERLIPPYSMVVLTKVGAGMWLVAKGSGGAGNYFNNATGGTVTEVQDYNGSGELWRVHTFTGNGSFEVLDSQQPFRVLAVGGGGGNGIYFNDSAGNGPGDGGQVFTNDAYTLSVGAYPFTIGAGGVARPAGDGAGGSGTATTAFGQTLNGGGSHGPSGTNRYRWGKGSAFQGAVHSYEYSRGVASDISGVLLEYGQGGSGYPGPIQYVGNGNLWTYGTGGRAWDSIVNNEGFGGSRDGNTGAVIVAYQIG